MSGPVLIALVGDDTIRAEELVAIVAGLVASYLGEMHKEEEFERSINAEGSKRTPAKSSDSIYQAVNHGPGTLQPGEHRKTIWAAR